MVQNALIHHKAQGLCHNFGNCPCWTRWYLGLRLGGLLAITKIYGSNIFQHFLKENNIGSKSNLDWCCNHSLGFAIKARGVARLYAKWETQSHITYSRECRKVWGNEPSHSQDNSHFRKWSPDGFLNVQKAITRVKTQWLLAFFISLKSSWKVVV
jgi:hypothetical protein